MIVKNEENCLENCLNSVSGIVDEIIIVDTGSEDRTKEIAAKYTDKIFDFVWVDDFSAARNYSFSKATKDYCMWLDADDIIPGESKRVFLEMKNSLKQNIDVVFMPYCYEFTEDGRIVRSIARERVIKRMKSGMWMYPVHEILDTSGESIFCEAAIYHTKKIVRHDKYFKIIEDLVEKGNVDPRILYYHAMELYERKCVDESIASFRNFFKNGGGESAYCFLACRMLHDLYINKKQYKEALETSMKHLEKCIHRSEFCCQLGYFYANVMNDINEAVYWFEQAVNCPYPTDRKDYSNIESDFYYCIPYFELGNAYCIQERYEEGLSCFVKAAEYNENHPEIQEALKKVCMVLFKTENTEMVISALKQR